MEMFLRRQKLPPRPSLRPFLRTGRRPDEETHTPCCFAQTSAPEHLLFGGVRFLESNTTSPFNSRTVCSRTTEKFFRTKVGFVRARSSCAFALMPEKKPPEPRSTIQYFPGGSGPSPLIARHAPLLR